LNNLKKQLAAMRGEKEGGRVTTEVFVRVGLSDPAVNARKLKEVLTADDEGDRTFLSKRYVGNTRDAFVEMIKARSAELLEAAVSTGNRRPIFVTHIHDEASMRFRSFDVVDGVQSSNRAMYSKVQNNAVTVHVGATSMEWPTELQPLASKNGATLATAMLEVMESVLDRVRAGVSRRPEKTGTIVHLLIGDGVNTNENAAKKVLHELVSNIGRGLRYRLLVWKCSSHQANLLCAVAVCGKLSADRQESSLCATLSRMFKYIFPSYMLELTWSLREYVHRHFKFVVEAEDSEETIAQQSRTARLLDLYGEEVLPKALLAVKNRHLSAMEHVTRPGGISEEEAKKEMGDVLCRLVLVAQERPVVTRFFVHAMLLLDVAHVLGRPSLRCSVLWSSVPRVRERKESGGGERIFSERVCRIGGPPGVSVSALDHLRHELDSQKRN
jgi:hypothetical protein